MEIFYGRYDGIRLPPPFPPVRPERFMSSAKKVKGPLQDARLAAEKIAGSSSLAKSIMEAAQGSNVDEVKNILKRSGLASNPDISFTPSSLTLTFRDTTAVLSCCELVMRLKWD